MRASSRFLPVIALSALACARTAPVAAPGPFPTPLASTQAPSLTPGSEGIAQPDLQGSGPSYAKSEPMRPDRNGLIPAGEACLGELNERGIAWQARKEERGVSTPVLVKGPIGNVRFFSDVTPFIADCRLVLALSDLAPEFEAKGVTQVRFSGAYVYRTRRSGTLSLHANGLAIDIHEVWFGSERLSVKKDFARGQGRECRPGMPRLNVLACRVREARLFKELLTPDDNADHHDHFHFGVARLPGEVPVEPPVILKPPVRKAPELLKNAPGALRKGKPQRSKQADPEEIAPLDDGLPGASVEEPAVEAEPEIEPHVEPAPEVEHPGSLPEILPESVEH